MDNSLILTYDIGTTGNKCSIFDSSGRNICSETVGYETIYPKPGWSEQDPESFWSSVVTGTKRLLDKCNRNFSEITVIGLSGHMNGCIPVDKAGKLLFNDIIHSDSRSRSESEYISGIFSDEAYYKITGNRIDPHYTLPKILWLRNNYPDIYNKTAYFLSSKDYISFKLTGELGFTDYSDASLTGMLDVSRKEWSKDIINGLDIDINTLPVLKKSSDIVGHLTKEASQLLGLHQGIPVAVGGGDGACATRGAGVFEKGQAYNYIGSSSWICTLNDKPALDKAARIFNFYDLDGKNCNVCGTVQSAAIAYDWVINNVAKYETEIAKKSGGNMFDILDDGASKVPPGSNGVFFAPYLMGERTPHWDKNTRGAFIGFTLFNSIYDMYRATYEGIAFALRNVLDVFEENGLQVGQLTLTGGGAKSRLWNEIMCNVYRKRILIHKYPQEATSLGAAIAAGVGVGIFKNFADAGALIEHTREYTPDEKLMTDYMKYYKVYNMLYPQLKPIYDAIAEI